MSQDLLLHPSSVPGSHGMGVLHPSGRAGGVSLHQGAPSWHGAPQSQRQLTQPQAESLALCSSPSFFSSPWPRSAFGMLYVALWFRQSPGLTLGDGLAWQSEAETWSCWVWFVSWGKLHCPLSPVQA